MKRDENFHGRRRGCANPIDEDHCLGPGSFLLIIHVKIGSLSRVFHVARIYFRDKKSSFKLFVIGFSYKLFTIDDSRTWWSNVIEHAPITVSYAWELTPVSMCYSQGGWI